MPTARCPTCGTELSGRAICPHCGTLAAAEFKLAHLRGSARAFVEGRLARFPRSFQPHHFLWACAVMPIFILPPMVSFFTAVNAIRKGRGGNGHNEATSYEWIAIISVLNILLSGLFLYKFHFSPTEIVGYLIDLVRSMIHSFTPYLPGAPSRPQLIPA